MSEMKPEKLDIPTDEFLLNFNLYEVTLKMKKEYDVYVRKIEERKTGFDKFLETIKNLPKQEKDEILHSINVEAKYSLAEVLEEFLLKFKEIMSELEYYCFYIKLEKKILEICDSFSFKIKNKMSFDIDDYSDPKNNIKKCPHCGEIWIRVEKCDNKTYCGNLPKSKDNNHNNKIFLKYEISWSDKKYTYKKKSMPTLIIDKKTNFEGKKTLGCGNSIVWKDLPYLTDEMLLQLFMVKSIEDVKKIANDVKFVSSYSKIDKTIDTKFYS